MSVYSEICAEDTEKVIDTGTRCNTLESVTSMLWMVKDDFGMTYEEAKDLVSINKLIKNNEIKPLFEMYEVQNADTDAVFYETGNFKKETKKARKGLTWENYLTLCSHSALRSYESLQYNRVIEITEDNIIIGVDGPEKWDEVNEVFVKTITGQLITEFNVGIRMRAVNDKPPYSAVTMTYSNYDELEKYGVLLKPDYDANVDVKPAIRVSLELVNVDAGATGIDDVTHLHVKIKSECGSYLSDKELLRGPDESNGNQNFYLMGTDYNGDIDDVKSKSTGDTIGFGPNRVDVINDNIYKIETIGNDFSVNDNYTLVDFDNYVLNSGNLSKILSYNKDTTIRVTNYIKKSEIQAIIDA